MPGKLVESGALWYRRIESGIRRHVRLLRNNGFNTTSSCEHRMEVTLNLYAAHLDELDALLQKSGFKDYTLLFRLERRKGMGGRRSFGVVQFGDDGTRRRIGCKYRSLVSWWWEPPP